MYMVRLIHLTKKRISQRGAGTKYYIDCSKYSENADSIQANILIRNTNHVAILKAVFTDEMIPKKNKHIVVKIMRSNKGTEREYNIGQELFAHKLHGFTPLNIINWTPEGCTVQCSTATLLVNELYQAPLREGRTDSNLNECIKYICLFSCYDTTNEDNIKITANEPSAKLDTKICQAESDAKNLKKVLVMPYISKGSIEDYSWNTENVHILKNILVHSVLALSVAYDELGFLHGDLHLGNILFKETKMETITYSSSHLGEISINAGGYKVVIMDFEKSETHVDKKPLSNVSFWDNIYIMLTRINTLPSNNEKRIDWENGDIIRFIKEAKKRKYPCERTHIVSIIEMIKLSVFDFFEIRNYKYNPDDV